MNWRSLQRALLALLAMLMVGLVPGVQAREPGASAALPAIRVADLPPEARITLDLIERGGPFPYRKDGATFMNRERLLPQRPRGYYREYTVRTPGERDRGARRIVAGRERERYYTADHYRSFKRITP